MRTDHRKDTFSPMYSVVLCPLLLFASTLPAISQSTRVVDGFQPGVYWGGRAVAIAVDSMINGVIVATESGGLFRSLDGGISWSHLDGLRPFRMSDVKYGPPGSAIVIATAMRDSRTINGGGIWRSVDGGNQWQRPGTVDPPATANCSTRASAYGIAFQPGTQNVYVGTDCGLAVSRDLGATWTHVVPDSVSPRVWSVVAPSNGSVYVCGDGGARLLPTQGSTWGPPFQGVGSCAGSAVHGIDFSPEAGTVFITAASGRLFQCAAGGGGCMDMQGPFGFARPFMVRVSPAVSPSNSVDVYYGTAGGVFRETCTIASGGLSCPANWGNQLPTGHSDTNDLSFGSGRCPDFVVTDGGVQKTIDCGNTWTNLGTGAVGFHSLGIYDVAGQIHPSHTDLYFGTQDNGFWSSLDGGPLMWPPPPALPFDQEGGGFQLERRCPDHSCRLIGWMQTGGIFSTNAHFAVALPWNGPPGNPQGCTPSLISRRVYAQFSQSPAGPGSTLYITRDDGGSWSSIVAVPQSLAGCPQVAGPADDPVLYQPIFLPGSTSAGDPLISLVRITGILMGTATVSRAGATLQSLGQYCMGQGVWPVGCPTVFGASRTDPLRLIAPDIATGQMKKSSDGGTSWTVDVPLTALVTGQGTFQFNFGSGDAGIRMQVHVVAFDPDDANHIVIGTEAAGLFESTDGGTTWNTITSSDRVTAVSAVFFGDDRSVIIATYGRGLWRLHDLVLPKALTPATVSWAPGRLDAFAVGSDGKMYHHSWDGSVWQAEWDSRGGPPTGQFIGSPSAVSWGPGRLDAFAVGSDGKMYHHSWNGSVWQAEWDSRGGPPTGQFIGSPSAVSWGPGRLDAFAIGSDGKMYHHSWNGSVWQAEWDSRGGPPTGQFIGSPSAVSWGPGRLDAFAIGSDGKMYHHSWNGSVWQAEWDLRSAPPPGQFIGSPSAVSWGPGRLDVFAIGSDGKMYHHSWNGSMWQAEWDSRGGPPTGQFVGSPSAVSWGPGRLDVFAIGSDGKMYHHSWNGSVWQAEWDSRGGPPTGQFVGSPSAVSWGPGRLDVFAIGSDGKMYHHSWNGSMWQAEWDSRGEPSTGQFR